MATIKKISIDNYKSIKHVEIPFDKVKGERYICFLGVNETGKTNILEAINLLNGEDATYSKFCYLPAQTKKEPIKVELHVTLTQDEQKEIKDLQEETAKTETPTPPTPPEQVVTTDEIQTLKKQDIFAVTEVDSDSNNYSYIEIEDKGGRHILSDELQKIVETYLPNVDLWKGREDEIISDVIFLQEIQDEKSEPFSNCLKIAGLDKTAVVGAKGNGGQQDELGEILSEKVTEYVTERWPNHDVSLRFHVSDERVTCNILDNSNPNRGRIAPSARSDGFKKLISFLLSLSVDYQHEEITNSLLLLDEPEMYLHPEAQQHFRNELKKISSKNSNIVMISTHSMYMIDKDQINKCYSVTKISPNKKEEFETRVAVINPDEMSYAQINYSIFNIPTAEYHNELYGYLQQKYIDGQTGTKIDHTIDGFDKDGFLSSVKKDKAWIKNKGSQTPKKYTLHTYIRHCIHHPENNMGNAPYTEKELRKSVDFLHKLKIDLRTGKRR